MFSGQPLGGVGQFIMSKLILARFSDMALKLCHELIRFESAPTVANARLHSCCVGPSCNCFGADQGNQFLCLLFFAFKKEMRSGGASE